MIEQLRQRNERANCAFLNAFLQIHLDGKEWTTKPEVLARAQEMTSQDGIGETAFYMAARGIMRVFGKTPGPRLDKFRVKRINDTHMVDVFARLMKEGKIESRTAPKEPMPGKSRGVEYSLTDMHPSYRPPLDERRLAETGSIPF